MDTVYTIEILILLKHIVCYPILRILYNSYIEKLMYHLKMRVRYL